MALFPNQLHLSFYFQEVCPWVKDRVQAARLDSCSPLPSSPGKTNGTEARSFFPSSLSIHFTLGPPEQRFSEPCSRDTPTDIQHTRPSVHRAAAFCKVGPGFPRHSRSPDALMTFEAASTTWVSLPGRTMQKSRAQPLVLSKTRLGNSGAHFPQVPKAPSQMFREF